jgi:tRNA/rRNA methyltransferase
MSEPLANLQSKIQIILVEPAGARNIGSIARVMKNMGLTQLVLINPECSHLGNEARHMAVHATDILIQAIIHPDLPTALKGVHHAVATIGRDSDRLVEPPRTVLPWLVAQTQPANSVGAIIFGREDHGLKNDQLKYAQRYLSIPTTAEYQSMNLAQAVGLCCYELHQATLSEPNPNPQPLRQPAALDQLEEYFQQLEALLLKIGYLYPHTAESRMATLRGLVKRSDPTAQDVAMLRGMIRQGEWALNHTPADRPETPTEKE